jgi:hypothetical protein
MMSDLNNQGEKKPIKLTNGAICGIIQIIGIILCFFSIGVLFGFAYATLALGLFLIFMGIFDRDCNSKNR